MITIVAHRGAPKHAHENTIESFLAAVSLGADMIELDVRKCGDGTLVIFHDPALPHEVHEACGARTRQNPPISRLTLKQINRRTSKKGFSVPTIEEAFRALSRRTLLDIEIKEQGYEAEIIDCARRHFDVSQFVLTSFNPQIVAAVKNIDPHLQTGFIMATAEGLALSDTSPAEVLAPDKRLFAVNRQLFAKAKSRGKRIAVWTVDSTEHLSRLLVDPLVDAIITNYPDRALALRNKLTNK